MRRSSRSLIFTLLTGRLEAAPARVVFCEPLVSSVEMTGSGFAVRVTIWVRQVAVVMIARQAWITKMTVHTGRHFLQIPGPTNVPDRVLRAMDRPVIDHRGPEFAKLGVEVLEALRPIFQTKGPVVIYPASGSGAWEASIVNTLSPGDRVLMFETGHFSGLWRDVAGRMGLVVDCVPGNWRRGVSPADVESRLSADKSHAIKAVMVVHNETSTGVTSRISEIRQAIDRARHPALLMVDTISSLASMDYRHDEWGVDVTVA